MVAADVARMLRAASCAPAGLDRHAALVAAFIRAGELVQGCADLQFERRGCDERTAAMDGGNELLAGMASAIDHSWREGFSGRFDPAPLLQQAGDLAVGGWIRTRAAEGYAHYALYPESYLAAARRSGLGPRACVIGIRSVGTGLGALVAAALSARPAISVRPVGHPFAREIKAAPEIVDADPADPDQHFAVVDEGPGLSGSSFASVAKWLCSHGAEPGRIHFFPSHEGEPGAAASAETRAVWRKCPRHPARSDDILLGPRGVRAWLGEQHLDPLNGTLAEFPVAATIPRDMRFERRKFLARGREGAWLIKFAGLGGGGARKQSDAHALARAGFIQETGPLCYGFLIQKHVEGRLPSRDVLSAPGLLRECFLARLASYLAFRAKSLGPPSQGASLDALADMAVANAREALGEADAGKLERQLGRLSSFKDFIRPVRTDNRLHSWEWLIADGGFVKLDALDHCEGHDLIGCQDIAWDVAGAIAEYEMSDDEAAALCAGIEAGGLARIDPALVAALLPCYLSFQLGLWATAAGPSAAMQAGRYKRILRRRLDLSS